MNIKEFNNRHGWFTQEEGEALFAFGLRATTALEIGCWEGRSTYALCEGVRQSVPGQTGTVIGVDHFLGVPDSGHNAPGGVYANLNEDRAGVVSRCLANTQYHRSLGMFFLLEAPFDDVFPLLQILFKHTPLDLAFVDDDHDYHVVKRRIQQCLQLLRPGGRLCGHDYRTAGNYGVMKAVDELLPGRHVFPNTSIWFYDLPK